MSLLQSSSAVILEPKKIKSNSVKRRGKIRSPDEPRAFSPPAAFSVWAAGTWFSWPESRSAEAGRARRWSGPVCLETPRLCAVAPATARGPLGQCLLGLHSCPLPTCGRIPKMCRAFQDVSGECQAWRCVSSFSGWQGKRLMTRLCLQRAVGTVQGTLAP